MRVAIVGAGLAGLACAHELERLGVIPEVFEKRHRIGERFPNVETMAQFFHHSPGEDIFQYIRHELHLPLNPANYITTMVLHGPSTEATVSGRLGYTTIRGHDERALEAQLGRHVKATVRYNTDPDVLELAQQYDQVVVATGDQRWTDTLTTWQPEIGWWVRGAVVKGDFNPSELHFFFRTEYAKTGYAMIAPFDERTASVGVGVPESSAEEVDECWGRFQAAEGHWWGEEVRQFKLEDLKAVTVSRLVIGNVLLVGNAGGFLEPIGIAGQCSAMASGVYGARQIVLGDRSLERYARRFRVYYRQLKRLRHVANAWTNREMDWLVTAARMGVGTMLAHSPLNVFQLAGRITPYLPLPDDPSPQIGPE